MRIRQFFQRLTRRHAIREGPSAALTRARLELALRHGTDPSSLAIRVGPRGNGRLRPPAPRPCCEEYPIVTACDGVTATVLCGLCRRQFEQPCPYAPLAAVSEA
jgi:hypothetical protein